MKLKPILLFVTIALIITAYFFLFASNTQSQNDKEYFYIKTGSQYDNLIEDLKTSQLLKNISTFQQVASLMSLPKNIHAGRYEIKKGMGNFEIVKMLKQGHQSPVKLVINKLRTKEDIINKLSSQLEPDTDKWKSLFIDTQFLQENKIDSNQIQVLILPNTYQVYWNTPPKKVF
ncbi:MAG: endolytic transglycosylase MltG, partial [Chitinophagaceae bacterium]|nr:endolytic transglycosylase MltG [Chitinophagaceae bacterium]